MSTLATIFKNALRKALVEVREHSVEYHHITAPALIRDWEEVLACEDTTTAHYNKLTEAQQERLVALIEECSEVVHIGCKILRHGYKEYHPAVGPSVTNLDTLEEELGNLVLAYERMITNNDVNGNRIYNKKVERASKPFYMHHQEK